MNHDGDPRTMGTLLGDAINQLTRLVRGEIALARAEVTQSVKQAGMGVALLAIAGILALVALNVLAAALVAALAPFMGAGWSALLVGVVILVVAGLLVLSGLAALKPENLTPTRTIRNVQADAQTIKETVTNDHHQH
jgi:apolipoprotein N-acyltransferase